jgi:hypothetical protein
MLSSDRTVPDIAHVHIGAYRLLVANDRISVMRFGAGCLVDRENGQ